MIDAIQGHVGRTSGDDYGDVTIAARIKVIDMLPGYDLGNDSQVHIVRSVAS